MRDFVGVIFLLWMSVSCGRAERDYSRALKRSDVYEQGRPANIFVTAPDLSGESVLYFCGVSVPRDYDWQRDTAIGGSDRCRIVFFRDYEEIVSFPTGYSAMCSTDPDTHHIISGHLFTEFSSAASTVILRDGAPYLSYSGRETLLGLVCQGDDVYTLGRSRSDGGIVYRCNGNVLLTCSGATSYGSFADCAYPETGALYLDDGRVCFAYWTELGGLKSSHMVLDGSDSEIDPASFTRNIQDVRMVGGMLYVCTLEKSGVCRLISETDEFRTWSQPGWGDLRIFTAREEPVVYPTALSYCYLSPDLFFQVPKVDGENYFFSRSCACVYEEKLCRAVTPRAKNSRPRVWIGEEETVLEMNGYLTGISTAAE